MQRAATLIAHLQDRAAALMAHGWTRREAEWLALVCLYSGVFLRSQYLAFAEAIRRSPTSSSGGAASTRSSSRGTGPGSGSAGSRRGNCIACSAQSTSGIAGPLRRRSCCAGCCRSTTCLTAISFHYHLYYQHVMSTARRHGPPHGPHIMALDQEQDSARSRSAPSDQRTLSCRIGKLLGSSVWSEVRAGLAAQSARLCVPAHRPCPRRHGRRAGGPDPYIWHDKPETARPVGLDPLRQRVRAVALHRKLAAGVALVSARTALSQDLVRNCDQAMRSRDAQTTQPAAPRNWSCRNASRTRPRTSPEQSCRGRR